MAPVRNRCQPVEVSFTQLETDHLPARETREQEISAHKAKAKVSCRLSQLHYMHMMRSWLKDSFYASEQATLKHGTVVWHGRDDVADHVMAVHHWQHAHVCHHTHVWVQHDICS